MRFRKVYIEITNYCNLNCPFCIGNKRKQKFITKDEFIIILKKIKPYTNYIYLHILGEPLLHPYINDLIDIATNMDFKVNITTNGYLINRIKANNIRQLNISLHSFNENIISLNKYLDNIFNKVDELNNTYISLRLWVNNKNSKDMIKYIEDRYGIIIDNTNNFKIKENVYLNSFHEFIWPDLKNDFYSDNGKCYGLIDHIGILVDGTIIPCCLDSAGQINLGNIFTSDIEQILKSKRVINMINGFKSGKKCEELCKHCSFLE